MRQSIEIGLPDPDIELDNLRLLREEGGVSPLVLDIFKVIYGAGSVIKKLRAGLTPTKQQPEKTQRNAGISI